MEDSTSELYVQIFLLVATILCYVILALFVIFGLYNCCLQACILRAKRNHQNDEEQQGTATETRGYWRNLKHPFQKDDKNVIFSSSSIATKNTPTAAVRNVAVEDITVSDNVLSNSNAFDERNPFIDKKYYDIFVA